MTCRRVGLVAAPLSHTYTRLQAPAVTWCCCRLCVWLEAAMVTVTGSVAEIREPKVSEANAPMG